MAAVGATTTAMRPATGRTMVVPAGPASPASPEDEERKKRTRRLVVLLVLLLVALAVIAFFLLRSVGLFGGGNVTVPNVVGQTARTATQTLQGDHLSVGTTTFRTSATAKGLVLSTDPKAGVSVSKNSAVALVISDGPNIPTVQVPSVTGEQLAPALQKLTAANLTYTVKYVNSNQPTGTVLNQIPAGGSSVKANVKVQLTVSGTQTSVQVPSVVGQSPAVGRLHPQGGRPQRG